MKIFNTALFTVGICLAGCSSSEKSQSSDKSQTQEAAPTVVASGVLGGNSVLGRFDVKAGQRIHVLEGMTDADEAATLIQSREVENRDAIERAYGLDSYHHYGNRGEDAMPPCKVADQDPVSVDEQQDLGYGSPTAPIHCTLDDGTDMYTTAIQP